jgi:hypothetical protein
MVCFYPLGLTSGKSQDMALLDGLGSYGNSTQPWANGDEPSLERERKGFEVLAISLPFDRARLLRRSGRRVRTRWVRGLKVTSVNEALELYGVSWIGKFRDLSGCMDNIEDERLSGLRRKILLTLTGVHSIDRQRESGRKSVGQHTTQAHSPALDVRLCCFLFESNRGQGQASSLRTVVQGMPLTLLRRKESRALLCLVSE